MTVSGELSALQDGGSGNDRLSVEARAQSGAPEIDLTLRGGLGDDVIQAFASTSGGVISGDIDGGQGDDTIGLQMEVDADAVTMPLRTRGGSGDDTIVVEAWNVSSTGGEVVTRTLGDAGDDVIEVAAFIEARGRGGAVETTVDGGECDDQITLGGGGAARQTSLAWGRNGADVIVSRQDVLDSCSISFRTMLNGGGDRDQLTAIVRAGQTSLNPKIDVSLIGGAGDDALSATVLLTAATFPVPSVVSVLPGGDGADRLRAEIVMTGQIQSGGSVRVESLLSGGSGDDRLEVVGGLKNVLDGGQGADVMIGGTGDDAYRVDNLRDVTLESGAASGGTDVVYSLVDHRLGQGIEQLVLLSLATTGIGNGRGNEITGTGLANTLHGYGGKDVLSGLGGNDLLYGGDGNDHVIGGDGDDQVKGGAGNDLLEGGVGDDLVVGGTGADRLFGDAGDDLLDGGEGNDVLEGGLGLDALLDGAGDDRISSQGGQLHGGSGDDWLSSALGSLHGDAGDDILQGSDLEGGAGDRLIAVGCFSRLDGCAGVDTIVIDLEKPRSQEIQFAFEADADRLEFSGIEDEGAPGLLDELDARVSFGVDEFGRTFANLETVVLYFNGVAPGVDSFADIVDDPATQLVVGEDVLI